MRCNSWLCVFMIFAMLLSTTPVGAGTIFVNSDIERDAAFDQLEMQLESEAESLTDDLAPINPAPANGITIQDMAGPNDGLVRTVNFTPVGLMIAAAATTTFTSPEPGTFLLMFLAIVGFALANMRYRRAR